MRPKSAFEVKAEAQRKHASARARQSRVDASVEGAARIKLSVEYAAESRAAWMALETMARTLKRTTALRLRIVGSRSFCEVAPGKAHDDLLTERRALGAALELLKPTQLVCGSNRGAERWSKIWADKYGIEVVEPSSALPDGAVAFPLDTWSEDVCARLDAVKLPVYRVAVR